MTWFESFVIGVEIVPHRLSNSICIVPVILCGGNGTRLWPRSRSSKPKTFLPLVGDSTLFEATVSRAGPSHGFSAPVDATGARHVEHVEAQLAGLEEALIIVKQAARNTSAAIALAALRLDHAGLPERSPHRQ